MESVCYDMSARSGPHCRPVPCRIDNGNRNMTAPEAADDAEPTKPATNHNRRDRPMHANSTYGHWSASRKQGRLSASLQHPGRIVDWCDHRVQPGQKLAITLS